MYPYVRSRRLTRPRWQSVQRSVAPLINVRLQIGQGRAKPSGTPVDLMPVIDLD